MSDQIFIQHRFTIAHEGLTYSDAIVLPQDEYQKLDEAAIEQIKTGRLDSWKSLVEKRAKEVEPTKEEQLALVDSEIAQLDEKKQLLIIQKQELESTTPVKGPVLVEKAK